MIRIISVPLAPFGRRQWRAWLVAMLEAAVTGGGNGAGGHGSEPCGPRTPGGQGGENLPTVELALLHDGDVAALNAAWLGCVGPTNILSFPAQSAPSFFSASLAEAPLPVFPAKRAGAGTPPDENGNGATAVLGSLFLSVDTLRRECVLYGQDEAEHARRLLAHGLAHLMGHDHGLAMDALCAVMMDAAAHG